MKAQIKKELRKATFESSQIEGGFPNLRVGTIEAEAADVTLSAVDDVNILLNTEGALGTKQVIIRDNNSTIATIDRSGIDLLTVGANATPTYKVDGTTISGGGGSATTDASDLTSGTLDDARLSTNVPLLDSNGDLNVSTIPDLNANVITSGTLSNDRLSGLVPIMASSFPDPKINVNNIPNLDASKLTSGTIASSRLSLTESDIPTLSQTKITNLTSDLAAKLTSSSALNADNLASGTVGSARLALTESDIPTLNQSKITSLTTDLANKLTSSSSLNADNLASGTISSARLQLTTDDIPTLAQSKISNLTTDLSALTAKTATLTVSASSPDSTTIADNVIELDASDSGGVNGVIRLKQNSNEIANIQSDGIHLVAGDVHLNSNTVLKFGANEIEFDEDDIVLPTNGKIKFGSGTPRQIATTDINGLEGLSVGTNFLTLSNYQIRFNGQNASGSLTSPAILTSLNGVLHTKADSNGFNIFTNHRPAFRLDEKDALIAVEPSNLPTTGSDATQRDDDFHLHIGPTAQFVHLGADSSFTQASSGTPALPALGGTVEPSVTLIGEHRHTQLSGGSSGIIRNAINSLETDHRLFIQGDTYVNGSLVVNDAIVGLNNQPSLGTNLSGVTIGRNNNSDVSFVTLASDKIRIGGSGGPDGNQCIINDSFAQSRVTAAFNNLRRLYVKGQMELHGDNANNERSELHFVGNTTSKIQIGDAVVISDGIDTSTDLVTSAFQSDKHIHFGQNAQFTHIGCHVGVAQSNDLLTGSNECGVTLIGEHRESEMSTNGGIVQAVNKMGSRHRLLNQGDAYINGTIFTRKPLMYDNLTAIDETTESPLFLARLTDTTQTGGSNRKYLRHNLFVVENDLNNSSEEGRLCYFDRQIDSPYINVSPNTSNTSTALSSMDRDHITFNQNGLYMIDACFGFEQQQGANNANTNNNGRVEVKLLMEFNSDGLYGIQAVYATRGTPGGGLNAEEGSIQLHEAVHITDYQNEHVRFYIRGDIQQGGIKCLRNHTKLRILKVG